MLKRIARSRIVRVAGVIVLVWLSISILLGVAVIVEGTADHAKPSDVIIVLGSGLRRDNSPGPALMRRSRHAAELHARGIADTIICTGGQTAGRTMSEASGCRSILLAEGVPDSAILLEERSRSTEENALFAHQIMRENGMETAVIVSDGYHLLRAAWIFQQEGIQAVTSPAAALGPRTLLIAVSREVIALQWQAFKTVFNLPFTYVPVV
jgi:uncharacterized SAM-binding protein YcdF (DUF218 family)